MSRPSPTAYLAVDLGSSSGRVMLGVLGAGVLSVREVARFPNVPVSVAEGLGWDVPALWRGVVDGLRAGVAAATAQDAAVRGIGVDSWGVDYGRITASGDLRPFARHHRDVDAAAAAQRSATADVAGEYAVTGVLDQAINTSHQLRQDAAAGIGAPDDAILPMADLFVHLLTGAVAAERSLASTTALLDRSTEDWSPALTAGVRGILPPLVDAGTPLGDVTDEVAARIGARVPVFAVTAHDTAAAFSAVADASDGAVGIVSSGSWAVAGVVLDRPILTEAARRAGFTQETGAGGETLLVKNLSGMWLLQQTMRDWAEEDATGPWTIDSLRGLLAEAAASTYPGRFDPADPELQAPGPLVPRIVAACTAAGADAPVSRADVVRAILDSLALAYAQTFDDVAALTGRPLVRLRLVGGGARNELLCALTAERVGLPVESGPVEASVLGVLFQLAVAAGDVPDLAAARALTIDDTPLDPTPASAAASSGGTV